MERGIKKLFVGNIPSPVTEETLRKKFEEHGAVSSLFYMRDQAVGDRGWAFVTFETLPEATKAVEALNGQRVFSAELGPLEVRFANQKAPGKEPAKPATGAATPAATAASSVWQQFISADGHLYYHNSLTGVSQWEKPAELEPAPVAAPAKPASVAFFNNTPMNIGPLGCNLFVANIPLDWNDIDLVQHFQHFGNILSSRIQRDKEGNSRHFAFVSFDSPQSAVDAIRGMNGFCVGGRFLRVHLKRGEEQYLAPALLAKIACAAESRSGGNKKPY